MCRTCIALRVAVAGVAAGSFKGFALLRQATRPVSRGAPGYPGYYPTEPRPVYAPGYGLIPASQVGEVRRNVTFPAAVCACMCGVCDVFVGVLFGVCVCVEVLMRLDPDACGSEAGLTGRVSTCNPHCCLALSWGMPRRSCRRARSSAPHATRLWLPRQPALGPGPVAVLTPFHSSLLPYSL